MVDREALHGALTDFVRASVADYGIGDMLYRLTDAAVTVLACEGAGVSVGDGTGSLRFITATDERIVRIEEEQVRDQQGPCHDAYTTGEMVAVENLSDAQDRWPDYYEVAFTNGCQAVLGVPMGVGETSFGALNIYQRQVHPWRDDELEAAQLLAEMASGYILNLRRLTTAQQLAGQLQAALDSRVVIEQAKGIVATRRDVDMASAFDLIRRHARDNNRKIHDVAGEIVSGDLEP